MKVLMLGWEFPPHITGGLGPACRGLSRALARAGVELTFVVPRAFGDEGADWMELREPDAGDPRHTAPFARSIGSAPAIQRRAVVAELAPYRSASHAPLTAAERAALAGLPTTAAGWHAFSERLAVEGSGDAAPARSGAPAREDAPFRGGYGPGLFGEVARYARRVVGLAREVGADLVHAHDWMTFPAGLAAARALGVPLVAHVHSTELDRAGAFPDERVLAVERMGLAAADRVVTVSEREARELVDTFGVDPARLAVVRNSVERRAAAGTRASGRPEPRAGSTAPPTVLFLGRVTRQKGPGLLLAAAERVVARRPDVRFVLAGDGDLLPDVVRRSAARGLAEHVLYTGFLGPDQVAAAYARADLFVLPSVAEPFGIAPLEAVDAGVPVLVSSASGVAEVLPSAPRFEPDDAAGLADAILDALASEARRAELVAAARADLARSSWDASAARLVSLFEELVGAGVAR